MSRPFRFYNTSFLPSHIYDLSESGFSIIYKNAVEEVTGQFQLRPVDKSDGLETYCINIPLFDAAHNPFSRSFFPECETKYLHRSVACFVRQPPNLNLLLTTHAASYPGPKSKRKQFLCVCLNPNRGSTKLTQTDN